MSKQNNRPKVVTVGGGFAGLYAAKGLANRPVSVMFVDRKNHHTFQPLLYQVATSVLSPGEIATPLRHTLHKAKNVEVILGEVTGFDTGDESRTCRIWLIILLLLQLEAYISARSVARQT